ncbi:MAG: DUF1552 domain-containing protein [Rhodospirillaceae bacterium]
MKDLSRRRVLRGTFGGAAVTVALPFLNCHLNSNGTALAATGKALPNIFGHWYQGLGLSPGKWIPAKVGAGYENNVQLKVLDPIKEKVNIFSGMRYFLDGRPHETHTSTVEIATTGAIFTSPEKIGASLDTNVADQIGTRTRFRTLNISLDGSRRSLSRRSANAVSPSEGVPFNLYSQIFGPEFKDPNAADFVPDKALMARRSVLSHVTSQRQDLIKDLGAEDRSRLDEYFTAVREIERQLDLGMEKPAPLPACTKSDEVEKTDAANVVTQIQKNSKLFSKLMAHALACGQTRVFNVNAGSQGWRFEGNPRGWHTTTHEESMDPTLGYQKTVFAFLTIANQTFADFLIELDSYKEGSGTLLDRTLVLWQTDHGDARTHTIEDIPIITAGSGGGVIKTGMHIVAPGDPCCRVGLTVQQAMGVPISTWGDMSNQTTKTVSEMMA